MKMSRLYKRNLLICLFAGIALIFMCLLLNISTHTESVYASSGDMTKTLGYTIHEVSDNVGYIPTKYNKISKFSNGESKLGTLSVSGDGFSIKKWKGYQAIALTGSEVSFKYKQNIASKYYGGHTWKLSADTNNELYGYTVGEIGNGGIIVLKSFNAGATWVKVTQSVKIDGTEFVFQPSANDLSQGVLYRFISVAEIYYTYQSGTKTNWVLWPFWSEQEPVYADHYTNLMQETIVYVASDNPVIGIYNEETKNHKIDLPKDVSKIEMEIIHKGVALSDNAISTSHIRLDFLKNKSNYVDYSYNGGDFKRAIDGQILSECGQYILRVKSVFETVRTYTLYIIDEETIFEAYFGDNIISQEKRIYNSLSNLPIYCKDSNYSINSSSKYLPLLYGSLSYYSDEKAINEGNCSIIKWSGVHELNGILDKNGYYVFEFTTGNPSCVNGDIVYFSFLAKVEEKGSYAPTVNKQLLTSSERNINLVKQAYMVPIYTTGGGAYVFCFSDLGTAEKFSYQAELRFVEDYYESDGLYFYKNKQGGIKIPYNSKVELYAAVKRISRQNVTRAIIDNTLQYGAMTLDDAVENLENTSFKKDVYVVTSIEERNKLCSQDIILNGFKFIQAAKYEVERVEAKNIASGEVFDIPFNTEMEAVLPNVTAKYQITEYNWAGLNSYEVSYLVDNSAKIKVSYTAESGEISIDINTNNTNTIDAKDGVVFEAAVDDMDSENIVVISKLGYIVIMSLKDLSGKYLDEAGEYSIVVKNRGGFLYSFKIVIAKNKCETMNTSATGIHLKTRATKDDNSDVFSNDRTNASIVSEANDFIYKCDNGNKIGLSVVLLIVFIVIICFAIIMILHRKRKNRF